MRLTSKGNVESTVGHTLLSAQSSIAGSNTDGLLKPIIQNLKKKNKTNIPQP